MTYNELVALTTRVTYPDHGWIVGTNGTNGFFIQIAYLEVDVDKPGSPPEEQKGRKWLVSEHAVAGEVFQTMLKAALTSAEHRIREHMLVDGVRVFGPHMPIEKLIEFVKANEEEHRAPMPAAESEFLTVPTLETKCNHGVEFDSAAARGLTSSEVRRRWPRLSGRCPKGCGFYGAAYVSYEHFVLGDW